MLPGLTKSFKGVGNFVVKWSVRLTKIFKHRMMTKRKNILIFAQSESPLYQYLYGKMHNGFDITRIYSNLPADTLESQTIQIASQDTEVEVSQENRKRTFYREYLLKDNFDQIERRLQGKQFDSIVVLPEPKEQEALFNFEDQGLATDYLKYHNKELMKSVFSYRLASKYLTTTGVLILSASERDFIKSEPEQARRKLKSWNQGKFWPSTELIDCQTVYLEVNVGQRDHTDLNSWSLVALSREWINENVEFVGKNYYTWASGQHLPIPGSFAMFKPKTEKHPSPYLQYL